MLFFDTIPPDQFTVLANLIGVLLAEDLDVDEQNSLGNFLITIGQALVTIAAQAVNLQAHQQGQHMEQQIDQLSKQIDLIKQQLKNKN